MMTNCLCELFLQYIKITEFGKTICKIINCMLFSFEFRENGGVAHNVRDAGV